MMLNREKLDIENIKKIMKVVVVVSFCSLFSVNFFIEGFIITISVIVLPILLYWHDDINSIKITLFVAIGSPLFRMVSLYLTNKDINLSFFTIWPEIFFYISYGVIFYFVYSKKRQSISEFGVAVFLGDFLSNIVEITLRLGFSLPSLDIIKGLAIIALIRTSIVLIIIIIAIKYKYFLIQEEHEKHYQKLLLMNSDFLSEIYFLEKNTIYIEKLMAKAFNLYKKSEELEANPVIVDMALDISKEVHEIKKDYLRVIEGLENVTEKKLFGLFIGIDEIADIIYKSTQKALENDDSNIVFTVTCKSKRKVRYHFYVASILRNLVNNAIESFDENEKGYVDVKIYEEKNNVIINITDTGHGIKERDIPYIFNPGFSSKYQGGTGDVQRGLGLSIVSGLLKEYFDTSIEVNSKANEGTSFKIAINIFVLKEGVK